MSKADVIEVEGTVLEKLTRELMIPMESVTTDL